MAILELDTNNYYKIDFEECMIKGNSVIVAFSNYATTKDREKEKTRRPLFTAFINNMQEKIGGIYDELIFASKELGLEPEQMTDENGNIDKENYPELRLKQDEMNALESMIESIYDKFYKRGNQKFQPIEYSVNKETLENYGYDESWVTDPICLNLSAQIYCGEYKGEEINYEFYYNRLKTHMNENIKDC